MKGNPGVRGPPGEPGIGLGASGEILKGAKVRDYSLSVCLPV